MIIGQENVGAGLQLVGTANGRYEKRSMRMHTPSGDRIFSFCQLVTPVGLKPATPRTGIWCSIQLSYGAGRF